MKSKSWFYWISFILTWASLIFFVSLFLFLIARIFVSIWSETYLKGFIPSLDIVEISYILVGVIIWSMLFSSRKARDFSNAFPTQVLVILLIPAFLWFYLTYWLFMYYWQFLLHVLVLLFSFATIVGVPIFVIWKLRRRKKALALELEDQLRELKEQLDFGHINQEEYDKKRKELLEDYQSNKEPTR
jgi:hypothetical protein